jgi:hypothetical protein
MTRRLAAVAFTLVLAGCAQPNKATGFTEPAATPQAATTTTPPPRAEDEYDGAQRLVGALNEAGVACLNWERTENPIGADERGSCYVGTQEIVASIYANHEDAAAEPESKGVLLAGVSDVDVVVGGNWTLSCDEADLCQQIADDFGGELVHIDA